jgi:hypothetical protein
MTIGGRSSRSPPQLATTSISLRTTTCSGTPKEAMGCFISFSMLAPDCRAAIPMSDNSADATSRCRPRLTRSASRQPDPSAPALPPPCAVAGAATFRPAPAPPTWPVPECVSSFIAGIQSTGTPPRAAWPAQKEPSASVSDVIHPSAPSVAPKGSQRSLEGARRKPHTRASGPVALSRKHRRRCLPGGIAVSTTSNGSGPCKALLACISARGN